MRLGTGGSRTAVLLALRYLSSHSHCVICPFVVVWAGLLKMWRGWGRAGCLWHRDLPAIYLPMGGRKGCLSLKEANAKLRISRFMRWNANEETVFFLNHDKWLEEELKQLYHCLCLPPSKTFQREINFEAFRRQKTKIVFKRGWSSFLKAISCESFHRFHIYLVLLHATRLHWTATDSEP